MGATKLRKELGDVMQEKLSVLHQVWSEMSLSKEEISSRHESIRKRVNDIFVALVKEESQLLATAKTQVCQFREEIQQIRSRLDIKPTKLDESMKKSASLLARREDLKSELDHLKSVAEKWRGNFEQLVTRSKILSDTLGLPSHYLVDSYNKSLIPSPWDIDILKNHIHGLTNEENKRMQEVNGLQDRINALQSELGIDSSTTASSGSTTKRMMLQDEYLHNLTVREHELTLIKNGRKTQLSEMRKTYETLKKMNGYTVEMSVDLDFDKLDDSNVKRIGATLDEINLKMQKNRLKFHAINEQDMSQEKATTPHTRRSNKIRSRSASELTASARTLRPMSSNNSRGTPYQKTLKSGRSSQGSDSSLDGSTNKSPPIKMRQGKTANQKDDYAGLHAS